MFYIKLFLCSLSLIIPLSYSWTMEKESLGRNHKRDHLQNLKTLGKNKYRHTPNEHISDYKRSIKEDPIKEEAPSLTPKEKIKKILPTHQYDSLVNPQNEPKATIVTVKTGELALLDTSPGHEEKEVDPSLTSQHVCLDYADFLNIEELHKQGLDGQNMKIAIIDGWFDYRATNIRDVLSRSTIEEEPAQGSVQDEQIQRRVFRGPGRGHGNHVSSIVNTIAPQAEIKYINFAERLVDSSSAPRYLTVRDIYNVLIKTITSKHKPDFINLSFQLPGEGDEDSQINNSMFSPIHPLIEDALRQIAAHNIGIIVAFGNDERTDIESNSLKSLIDLANDPRMKGRLLLASASQIEAGTEEIYEKSNYVLQQSSAAHLLTAPGYNIAALGPKGYEMVKSGTSQSAPMITATAALIKQFLAAQQSKSPSQILPEEIFDLMLASARDKDYTGSCPLDVRYGQGILNPLGAIKIADEYYSHFRE